MNILFLKQIEQKLLLNLGKSYKNFTPVNYSLT
jgi:hypothetical protein